MFHQSAAAWKDWADSALGHAGLATVAAFVSESQLSSASVVIM
jgi:hypothetical protein